MREGRGLERSELLLVGVACEGCADYFFGRPLEANPYSCSYEPCWASWREGWLEGQFFDEVRGERERARWAA